MSAPEEPSKSDIEMKVREALGRATLARARNQLEQALKLAQEAIDLDDTNAEAYELKGDLLLQLKRGEEAMACFSRAREMFPDRVTLEDKIARAALQKAARQRTIELSQALLEGRARPAGPRRNPGYAALLSLVVPGLGQLYNGEILKGLVMVLAYVVLFALTVLAVLRGVQAGPTGVGGVAYGAPADAGTVFSALSSGSTIVVSVSLALLWIYAIGDAALRAGRTLTSDDTGLV